MVDPPAVKLHKSGRRHHLQIAEVAVISHSAHVRKAEAFDRSLFVGVAWAVVAFKGVVRAFNASRNRVRAELHHAKRRCGTRESFALAQCQASAGTDEWIDEARGPICGLQRLFPQTT